MNWTSKYDTTFVTYANRIYNKRFKNYDDFSCWLFFKKNEENDTEYYCELEELLRGYSYWQVEKIKEIKETE